MKLTTTRRQASAWLCAGLVLAGCDRSASAPEGFRPDSRFGCADLVGDYRIDDVRDAATWMPSGEVDDVTDWFALSIEHDPLQGGLRMVLRREPSKLQREATALRDRSPDDYARWREQLRYALQLDRGEPGQAYGESILRRHGPAVEIARSVAVSDDCERGWAPSPHAGSNLLLARGADGALLMQLKRFREVSTGFSFFGTQVSYPRYERTDWYRLAPLPASTQVRFDAAALSPAITRVTPRSPSPAEAERATRELATEIEALLRRGMSRGVTITVLRPTQFDPAALALAPIAVRMEIAGSFDARLDPDPFQQLLQKMKRADSIELRERSARGADRAYALVHFTWRASTPSGR